MELLKYVEEQLTKENIYPDFRAGDNVTVSYKIIEGSKERIQAFRGDVIQISGERMTKTFTVRKISNGVGVERIFPFNTPNIVEIKINKHGKVRRSRLYYLRDLVGKKARIKEKQTIRKK
ncbi:MAG: large subunit ribosomal protein L19 [Saprospiraceae bacterium]|jgi:large subunit ribosomal protein L19